MNATHIISRLGMKAVPAEFVFGCPNYWVFLVNGQERTLPAKDGIVQGFTITPVRV